MKRKEVADIRYRYFSGPSPLSSCGFPHLHLCGSLSSVCTLFQGFVLLYCNPYCGSGTLGESLIYPFSVPFHCFALLVYVPEMWVGSMLDIIYMMYHQGSGSAGEEREKHTLYLRRRPTPARCSAHNSENCICEVGAGDCAAPTYIYFVYPSPLPSCRLLACGFAVPHLRLYSRSLLRCGGWVPEMLMGHLSFD